MSEIKGQILGVVLVLAIFGVVGTALYSAFKTSAENVSNSIKDESNLIKKDTTTEGNKDGTENNSNISIRDLLSF